VGRGVLSRRLAIGLIVTQGLGCTGHSAPESSRQAPVPRRYPSGFLEPPDAVGACVASGIGVGFRDPVGLACRDAVAGLDWCDPFDLSIERAFLRWFDGIKPRGSRYREALLDSTRGEDEFAGVVLDTAHVDGMTLVLVSTRSVPFDGAMRVCDVPPEWVRHPPHDLSGHVGVGQSAAGPRLADAWRRAERAARKNLVESRELRVDDFESRLGDKRLGVAVTRASGTVSGYRVAARFHDAASNACFVLVRCDRIE